MDWPAYSPDLNPIEHMWDALERPIAARLHHPENTQQLKQMLIEEWVLYHGRAYTILRNILLFFLQDRQS
ncbi:transposable element Tcb2 transposase [Trichonephila clavipes]|uniref:Transposable element Tcb2 transposase n=1 Tax=Trichonephila clavipes TaxID=2585209 RepID=A0A8X6W0X5_TRICX|nr:transposable element Tcb2 transposase [Trichonephila clavipes]